MGDAAQPTNELRSARLNQSSPVMLALNGGGASNGRRRLSPPARLPSAGEGAKRLGASQPDAATERVEFRSEPVDIAAQCVLVNPLPVNDFRPGGIGEASVLALERGVFDYVDSTGEHMTGDQRLAASGVIVNGRWSNARSIQAL